MNKINRYCSTALTVLPAIIVILICAHAQAQQTAMVDGEAKPYKLEEAKYEKGLKGEAIRITGEKGYAEIEKSATIPQPESFTIEILVKLDSLPAGGTIAARRSTEAGNIWQLYTHATGVVFFLAYGKGNAIALDVRDAGAMQVGRWHHVCVSVEKNGKVRFYLDGKQTSEGTFSSPLSQVEAPIRIGGLGYTGKPLQGLLSDFRFYPGPVSPNRLEEIKTQVGSQ
ncbi:MAG: hypothetical protein A2X48_00015 [Lentisphaerae bacterium GWF2_49_21]|nr:MAG: hypothetical protein A2X48_00015 [Lentisphaerae bacterium GWF2_49_21]